MIMVHLCFQNLRDLLEKESKADSENMFPDEIKSEGLNQDVEVLQTEQFVESECPGCINLKAKLVKLQKQVSYLKKIRNQLYSRIEKVCIYNFKGL